MINISKVGDKVLQWGIGHTTSCSFLSKSLLCNQRETNKNVRVQRSQLNQGEKWNLSEGSFLPARFSCPKSTLACLWKLPGTLTNLETASSFYFSCKSGQAQWQPHIPSHKKGDTVLSGRHSSYLSGIWLQHGSLQTLCLRGKSSKLLFLSSKSSVFKILPLSKTTKTVKLVSANMRNFSQRWINHL